MTAVEYALAVLLGCAVCILAVAASSSLLDGWLDARRRRARDRDELEAWRRFHDGGWPR